MVARAMNELFDGNYELCHLETERLWGPSMHERPENSRETFDARLFRPKTE